MALVGSGGTPIEATCGKTAAKIMRFVVQKGN